MNYNQLLVFLIFITQMAIVCSSEAQVASHNSSLRVESLTLVEAEKLFLKNNLTLLAARFNIEASKALALQSKLWANPNFQLGQNLYNQNTNKWLDITSTGNTDWQLTQLISIAGKYSEKIKIADWNTKISEHQFEDLVRVLKFQLRTKFYTLAIRQQQLRFVDEGVKRLQQTVSAAEKLYARRSILLSESLRLKALLAAIQLDRLTVLEDIANTQSDLKYLLYAQAQPGVVIEPKMNLEKTDTLQVLSSIQQARREFHLEDRPDIRVLEAQVFQEENNLKLQKLTPLPDLQVGYSYSRAGSYIRDYTALMIGFNIPIFDLNSGNIKASQAALMGKRALYDLAKADAQNDFSATLTKAEETEKTWQTTDRRFTTDYLGLVDMMIHNYQKKNMTIIAFADFYESYRTSLLKFQDLRLHRLQLFEELNRSAGRDVIVIPGEM